jgi:hypothetical protein
MRFNDRSMALLGIPDLPTEAFKHAGDRRIKPQGGGGGPNQTTSYQTNIPEYAKPYVETMLGATQKQLFQGTPTGDGGFNITGFQPYKSYGGTYAKAGEINPGTGKPYEGGEQTSYDPGKGIAGFQPMQTTAQQGVAGMQVPGQYGQAMDITGAGVRGAIGTAGQGVNLSGLGYEAAGAGNRYAQQATNPSDMQAYMSPYMQNVVDIQQREAQRQADIAGTQRGAQAVKSGAFGGSRQAIMEAEAARNLAQQKGDIQATGLQSAFQQAQQAQQYGANLGLQGLQAGMQGVGAGIGAQQAAYNQAMQGANQLASLGGQQFKTQQDIYNLQNQFGGQQQALEQQKLNQAMQDYANAQQYPLMQLGTMSNMIRGLPMQASTTQQYQAQPSMLTQGIGALGAGTSLYNAFNPPKPGGAAGGLPSEFKYSKGGGIMSYNIGGELEGDLESASDEFLNRQIKESSSPSVKRMAQRILRERQMSKGPGLAGGGIIAFKEGSEEPVEAKEPTASEILQQRVMQGKPTGDVMEKPLGITQAAPPPPPPPPAAPLTREQAVQASNAPAELKSMFGAAQTESARPISDFAKELETEYKAAGVEQRSPEERANLMKERANAEDEAHRQRYLRMAEMFAAWGSTPGPTLAAGLAAFKNSVPSLISDEKEATKIRKEIDKSLAGLDESIRLEKRGLVDKAAERKTAAVKKMEDVYTEVVKFKTKEVEEERANAAQEKRDLRTREGEEAKDIRYAGLQKEITQMKIDADAKNNKMLADFRAADKVEAGKDRLLTLYRGAQSDIASAESRIQNIMKSPEYQDALANSKATITKESGTAAVKMRDDAVEALKGFNESFKTQREAVDSTVKFMEDRLNAKGIELPVKKSKGSDKPPPLPPGAKLD